MACPRRGAGAAPSKGRRNMNSGERLNHIPARCAILCAGITIMAFGIAFSIKAGLGTSPVSSVPYVASAISGLSVGTTTILVNTLFVVIQILLLRRRYQWIQLLQIPAAVLLGVMIDLGGAVIAGIPCQGYLQRWALCAVGIFLVGAGVGIEVMAKLVTTAGEGLVLAICQVVPVKFGNMKIIFDLSLVSIAIAASLLWFGRLEGVREGTVAAALWVGLVAKLLAAPMRRLEETFLK